MKKTFYQRESDLFIHLNYCYLRFWREIEKNLIMSSSCSLQKIITRTTTALIGSSMLLFNPSDENDNENTTGYYKMDEQDVEL